jgi:hypothetical protein
MMVRLIEPLSESGKENVCGVITILMNHPVQYETPKEQQPRSCSKSNKVFELDGGIHVLG